MIQSLYYISSKVTMCACLKHVKLYFLQHTAGRQVVNMVQLLTHTGRGLLYLILQIKSHQFRLWSESKALLCLNKTFTGVYKKKKAHRDVSWQCEWFLNVDVCTCCSTACHSWHHCGLSVEHLSLSHRWILKAACIRWGCDWCWLKNWHLSSGSHRFSL